MDMAAREIEPVRLPLSLFPTARLVYCTYRIIIKSLVTN